MNEHRRTGVISDVPPAKPGRRARWCAFAVGVALAACSTESSSGVETGKMDAQLRASADEGGTTVTAQLTESPLHYYQLTRDDEFRGTLGSQSRALAETSLMGEVEYSARFDANAGVVHVRLSRKVDAGAPDSYVTLPDPFTLAPMRASYASAEAITVAWTGGAGALPMSLKYQSSGCSLRSEDVAIAIPAGDTSFTFDPEAIGSTGLGAPCDVKVTVTRGPAQGHLDSAFRAGGFTASQSRSVSFNLSQ